MSTAFPGLNEIRAVIDGPYSKPHKNLATLPFVGVCLSNRAEFLDTMNPCRNVFKKFLLTRASPRAVTPKK